MRLLIDAGNSRIKWALAGDGHELDVMQLPISQAAELASHFAGPDFDAVRQVWVSNVAGGEVARLLQVACALRHWQLHFIEAQALQCGVRNRYVQPARLGSDRWAALIAAWQLAGRACLVVCSGTATTVDALSDEGVFMGGLILPGLALMQQSLAEGTAQLQVGVGSYAGFPCNTADALLSGAVQATCGAIQRQFDLLAVPGALVLLSGGAAPALQFYLHLPVQMVDNLVLQGVSLIAREVEHE